MDTSSCKYMGIRISLKVLVLIFFTLLLSDCEDEKAHPREYPRLNTIRVSNITEKGATFNAEIISPGTEPIIEHGFVWGTDENLDFQNDNRISLGAIKNAGTFSAAISTTLEKGWKYSVKPFVETEDHMVYGAVVTFESLGSEAPQITGFEPSFAGWMDTVKIKGRNFSWSAALNKVMFNQTECEVLSATDTTLLIRISTNLNAVKSIISVNLAGNVAVHIKDTFRLIPPALSDFYPKQARWGDTLFLKGKHLKYFGSTNGNYVKLGTISCTYLGYKNDSIIFVKIPLSLVTLSSNLSVLINTFNLQGSQPFQLLLPQIGDYYPKEAKWGDTLHVKGAKIKHYFLLGGLTVKLGTFPCSILAYENDSTLSVRVPYEVNSLTSVLSLSINGSTSSNNQSFQLLQPIFSFNPQEGTWSNNISLSGTFNTIASRNSVFFDDVQATIVSTSAKLLTVSVPPALSKVKTNIIYKATPFTVTSQDTFRLKGPVINSFSPSSGLGNTIVTIKGKYFSSSFTTVRFGTVSGIITNINDSTINVRVPSGVNGPVKISITVKLQTTNSVEDFIVINPMINSVFPLSATFNDEITIEGVNFIPPTGNTTVSFGTIQATIKSVTETSIVVSVPLSVDSIPRNITVTAGSNSAVSAEKFVLSPPQIFSISPEEQIPGQDITITGLNFHPTPSNNTIFWDSYPLVVKSVTGSEIVVTLPQGLPRGSFKIKLSISGYTKYSAQDLTINNSMWSKIPSPQIHTNYSDVIYGSIFNYGGTIKDIGYIASAAMRSTYKFDPLDNTWVKINDFPCLTGNCKIALMGEVVCKDTFYLISGQNYKMIALDQTNNNWRTSSEVAPGNIPGVAFALNNKIYFGLHYFVELNSFWECDPANNYKWTRKGDFPITPPTPFATYFTLANKGYVVFSNNNVWQFDPDLLLWTRKSDFPGQPRQLAISFVLNGIAYMGTGRDTNSNALNDIWQYNPISDSWVMVSQMPNARYSAVALTIKNKAYIGFGMVKNESYPSDLFDFYEFDPNYLLK